MIIDTMVFAYALVETPEFHDESLEVLNSGTEIVVPDSLRAELVNVMWQWVIHRGLPLQTGLESLQYADGLINQVIPANLLWEHALVLAVEVNHSPYDTLFIAVAELVDSQVITYDARLQSAFPDIAISPSEFLS